MVSENVFLFHALLLGAYITFVYDWLRIFRRVIPHSLFFVSLEDICYWLYCAVQVFLLLYHESNGTLRWFGVLGAGLGIFLYKKCFSEFLVKYVSLVLCKVLKVLRKVFGGLFRFLCRPFRFLYRKMAVPIGRCIRTKKQVIKLRLTALRKTHKMKREAKALERKSHGKTKSCVSQETSESV